MKKRLMIILGLSLLIFSLNARATWTTKRLTYNPMDSEYPDIAIDSNNYIHVVWEDHSPGNFEIFYKRNILFNPKASITPNEMKRSP